MATKNRPFLLPLNDKELVNPDNKDNQYSNFNFNLNHSHKSSDLSSSSVQSNSKSLKNYKNHDSKNVENQRKKESLKLCNKSTSNNKHSSEEEKRQKKFNSFSSSNTSSSSTLSLHIAAYENSIIDGDTVSLNESKGKGILTSVLNRKRKHAFISSISNPFEFPRQQTDEIREPEITQFKASQQLFDPNQSTASNSVQQVKEIQKENTCKLFQVKDRDFVSSRPKRVDPKEYDFEWHAVLRIPKSKVPILDEIIDNQISEEGCGIGGEKVQKTEPGESVLGINFEKSLQRGQLRLNEEYIGFSVRDLPCIVETYKTHDNVILYKVGDVSQILICHDDAILPPPPSGEIYAKEIEDSNNMESARESRLKLSRFPHGLTPPMKNVTKRRFRKTKKTKFIDAPKIEIELRGIFRRDMEANMIEFQLIDEEENRLDSVEEPILPIVEIANPFKPIIKPQPN